MRRKDIQGSGFAFHGCFSSGLLFPWFWCLCLVFHSTWTLTEVDIPVFRIGIRELFYPIYGWSRYHRIYRSGCCAGSDRLHYLLYDRYALWITPAMPSRAISADAYFLFFIHVFLCLLYTLFLTGFSYGASLFLFPCLICRRCKFLPHTFKSQTQSASERFNPRSEHIQELRVVI
jgi:hypothetical protein